MENYLQDHSSYRSKERIKDYGEVFTPEEYIANNLAETLAPSDELA